MRRRKRRLTESAITKELAENLKLDEDILRAIIREYWFYFLEKQNEYDEFILPVGRIKITCSKKGYKYITLKISKKYKKTLVI